MDSESVQQQRLEERNARLEEELELLRGVLALVKEDLHVKNDQIEHLYHTFLASREHKRQEQEQRENALKQQVGKLETEIRAKERSFQQLHSSLQKIRIEHNTSRSLAMHEPQFHELPAVLVVNVLSYLDGSDIICAASMHRNWYVIAMCNSFWKGIYALRWQNVDAKQQGRNFANEFTSKYLKSKTAFPLQVSRAAMDGTLEISTEPVEWMTLYRERHIVERNWVNGKATITTLNGHNGTITCLQYNDSRLVSGSDDGSMMLWSLLPRQEESSSSMGMSSPHAAATPALMQQHHRQQKSVEKLHSFYGHGGPVWALHFQENTLISGSYDKTVKIWDLQTGKCQNTLRGHAGWVSSLDSNDALIASASWDSCINVWDLATGTLLRTLQDSPVNPIYSLTWDHFQNAFITGCKRFGVQVWDVESGLKLNTFIGHDAKNQVNSVKACDERIISGGSDHTVKIWDRRQSACTSTLLGHRGSVMCVDYDQNDKVISGSYDSVTKLWDLRRTASALSTFEGHSSAVFSLQMDATKMISGSADTTIKIFRFL